MSDLLSTAYLCARDNGLRLTFDPAMKAELIVESIENDRHGWKGRSWTKIRFGELTLAAAETPERALSLAQKRIAYINRLLADQVLERAFRGRAGALRGRVRGVGGTMNLEIGQLFYAESEGGVPFLCEVTGIQDHVAAARVINGDFSLAHDLVNGDTWFVDRSVEILNFKILYSDEFPFPVDLRRTGSELYNDAINWAQKQVRRVM